MTEQKREEIVRQMAVAIRKQKFARTGRIGCFDETNITDDELSEARAALAVAEPVIREQCAGIADKHSSEVSVSKFATATNALCAQKMAKDIAAAIREGGKDEN